MEVTFSVVLVGLDATGKTTLISSLKNSTDEVFPTAGFKIDYLNIPKIPKPILVYDCSGASLHRNNWKTFYRYVDAIMFFIDVTDVGRLKYAKEQLEELLKNQTVSQRKLPICIMLNKCDKAHQAKEIFYQALELEMLQKQYQNKMYLKETSGFTKEGAEDCFLWTNSNI